MLVTVKMILIMMIMVTGGDGEVMADREVIDADATCKVCKVHYSALQCVTVCYSVLQCVILFGSMVTGYRQGIW